MNHSHEHTPRDRVFAAARDWGWLLAIAVSVVVSVIAVALVYSRLDVPGVGKLPATTEEIVPTSGLEGFPVEEFCEDPATEVKYSIIPHVGFSHELLRLKDGVTELVTISITEEGEVLPGTHYYDTNVGQQSEPAIAGDGAVRCIEDKRKLALE